MGDRVRSPCRQISGIDQHQERADLCRLFCILEEVWLHTPTKEGFQRVSLWHTTLLAKCSVLYLLAWLTGETGCGASCAPFAPAGKQAEFLRMGMSKKSACFQRTAAGI